MKNDFALWEKELGTTQLKPIDITINQTNNYYPQNKEPRFPHLGFNLLVFVGIPVLLFGLFVLGFTIWGLL